MPQFVSPFSEIFAHSLADQPVEQWEPLSLHLTSVAERAASFAAPFGWAALGRLAGMLHDLGKLSPDFQAYIRKDRARGGDHAAAGARLARDADMGFLSSLLAAVVAAHHGGLRDGVDLDGRLQDADGPIPARWQELIGPLPAVDALAPTQMFRQSEEKGFYLSFLYRMLFSCLVDADFLETERFYAEAKEERVSRGGHSSLDVLRDRLRDRMAAMRGATPTPLNLLRNEILDHAVAKAALPPGLFTLTVPTGGGKTLASLSFALDHAVTNKLRRVIYVIPFTSIIEQTAEVFREALQSPQDVLEHHASFDWDRTVGEGRDGLAKLQRAAENWDVPIVVTTAVQFFESLFANRPSRCRKLHNIAGSVIILDEAQTLPLDLLMPCMAAIDELARNYRVSVVLCTATQPALRKRDGALIDKQNKPLGFDLDEGRELAPEPTRLYEALKRVTVEVVSDPVADEVITNRFAEQPQMLCIVNSRGHARALFAAISSLPGAVHLTTLMCPRHRRMVLADLRERLKAGLPVRLVATSLIEAGVDIDFPEVWRAAAGLDSIAQAAGRCNREGGPVPGRVVVFEPAEAKPPRELKVRWEAARPVLGRHADPLGLDAVRDYFRELYFRKGDARVAFDQAKVGDKRRVGILPAIAERANSGAFPFESIANAFRMIEQTAEPVVVPWRADGDDHTVERLFAAIAVQDRPRAADLRRLQQYVVPIPKPARDAWLAAGVLRPVHPALGEAMLRFEDLAHYDGATGVRLGDIDRRDSEMNVIS
ncbi:CRISPR-associated endonuclease Cas3'' [Telmatospirillum sp.]|uniref:CRISPR-associated endonuclease Cas3'' n=1 Tax=Telmatospirillum sp. TaxID=2079197 RepID=UPI00283F0014|nr:CRISPR-associated endonuclease Cas3'' [Telmatospirillum sp.]MDR3438859.1 CRISPR-associated endonuclease Cas3'' [Telmatospirillum sp.]